MTTSRQKEIAALLAASGKCLQRDNKLDAEIVATLRQLIGLLIARYQNWSGKQISLGPECTNGVFSAAELRTLIRARAASRGGFPHRTFSAIVRDALRSAPEEATYVISGLFVPNDNRPPPEPVQRHSCALIDLLREMEN